MTRKPSKINSADLDVYIEQLEYVFNNIEELNGKGVYIATTNKLIAVINDLKLHREYEEKNK